MVCAIDVADGHDLGVLAPRDVTTGALDMNMVGTQIIEKFLCS